MVLSEENTSVLESKLLDYRISPESKFDKNGLMFSDQGLGLHMVFQIILDKLVFQVPS